MALIEAIRAAERLLPPSVNQALEVMSGMFPSAQAAETYVQLGKLTPKVAFSLLRAEIASSTPQLVELLSKIPPSGNLVMVAGAAIGAGVGYVAGFTVGWDVGRRRGGCLTAALVGGVITGPPVAVVGFIVGSSAGLAITHFLQLPTG